MSTRGRCRSTSVRTNDWMDTHVFEEGVKVQCFCLTLIGELDYGMSHYTYKCRLDQVTKSV